jgi:glutaredoxin
MKERGLSHKMYQMYTLQTCPHCHEAIEFMKQRNIEFEKIDASSPEGMNKFKNFYSKYRDQIKRVNGTVDLPILVHQDNGNTRIHQGSEGLEKFLGA